MLEVDGLTRTFGASTALDALSFAAQPGRMTGFVGPNGAGKTTTMRVILGLLSADSGDVSFRGAPLDAAARRRFGYMPEERGLYARMRVGDQLEYLARLHGMSSVEARTAAGGWLERLGLGDRADTALDKLSLGNQQRVQLGAALVHEPDALVLDEPFSGLDPTGVDAMAAALREQCARGVVVLFSSHQLELVERLCEDVVIISEGRLVAAGPVAEVRRARRVRRLRVVVEGAEPGWVERVGDVEVVAAEGDTVVIGKADEAAEQRVLYEAQVAGRLREFGALEPTLAELFREVVS